MQPESRKGRFGLPWSQCRSRQGIGYEDDYAEAETEKEAGGGRALDLLFRAIGKDGGIVRAAAEKAGEADQGCNRTGERLGEDSAEREIDHSSPRLLSKADKTFL
jgi:hypothetical protein